MKIPFFKQSKNKTIHLILAVSSAGKSTYIEQHADFLKKDIPIYLAHELDNKDLDQKLSGECVIHYNLFRPYKNKVENIANKIMDDLLLNKLMKYSSRIKATLLIAPKGVIAKRMLLRHTGEAQLRGHTQNTYPKYNMFELLQRIDFKELYMQWLNLLRDNNISLEVLDSSNLNYKVVAYSDIHQLINSEEMPDYSHGEMSQIIQEGRFEYQQISISETLVTKGQDRSETFDLINNNLSFENKSVLDIGCAYGLFCYEIESQGAVKIVGTEQKSHRFIGANIIKQFKKSACEFRFENVFEKEKNESFDIVLFLNVIHHLKDPITALYALAEMCQETLVIEFPTLKDNKFNATISSVVSIDDELPLIGVSKLKEQDQIFVFNNAALKRILIDNSSTPFKRITFHPSPMSDERSIAICTK